MWSHFARRVRFPRFSFARRGIRWTGYGGRNGAETGTLPERLALTRDDSERAVREFYRAYAEQDGEALMRMIAPDEVLHVSGRHGLSGAYRGVEEIFGYIGKVGAWTGGLGGFEVDAVMTDEDGHAAAIVTGTAIHEGETFTRQLVHLFTFRDDQTVEFRDLPFDQHAEDEFWPSA